MGASPSRRVRCSRSRPASSTARRPEERPFGQHHFRAGRHRDRTRRAGLRPSATSRPTRCVPAPGIRREDAEPVVRQRRRRERGDLGMVEGRRHLDDVHPDQRQPAEPAHQLRAPASSRARPAPACRYPARRPDRARRCRTRDRPAPPPPASRITASAASIPCRCTQGAVRISSPSALWWKVRMPIWVERARSTSPSRIARPIIVPWSIRPGIVRPEVAVGVELHQRQRPVLRRMRPEQRPGDEMVPPERQELRPARDHLRRRRLDRGRHALGMVRVEHGVAAVDDRERLQAGRTPTETP